MGKIVWRSIRDMQRCRKGLRPVRSVTVKDESGSPCITETSLHQRWRRHFTSVLNIRSNFSQSVLESVEQRPVRQSMADLPSVEEMFEAVKRLRNGKAAGSNGILPEMLKAASKVETFRSRLLDLVHSVWREGRVPQQWSDAILVPVPKKGDLSLCDNWRGISLLDVVGKMVAGIVRGRLQELADDVLPESQCGFRKGRGCSDMIYTVRQLVEKSCEHNAKVWFVFIDLKKAYDSVPREALWLALAKLGVPDSLIGLIRSFHQDMKARIRLEDENLEEIEVNNGLRQGCCMAPSLFNLYSSLLVDLWTSRMKHVEGAGVYIRHKDDGKLFRRYTRNSEITQLNECQFADDAALLATTREGAERALKEYMQVAREFGLTVNLRKTKVMVTGKTATEEEKAPLNVEGNDTVEYVSEFTYLGSEIAESGRVSSEVDRRIMQASKAFGCLRKAVFADRDLSLETKRKIYVACVFSVLL